MTTPSGMSQKAVVRGLELRLDTALQGLKSALPEGVKEIHVGTMTLSVDDAIKLAEGVAKPWKDARTARAVIRQVILSRPKDKVTALEFLSDLKAGLVVLLGRENEELVKFGFAVPKPRRGLTIEEKARRAAKAKLTREKRHTMGTRQKAELRAEGTPEISIPEHGDMVVVAGNGDGLHDAPASPPPPPAAGK